MSENGRGQNGNGRRYTPPRHDGGQGGPLDSRHGQRLMAQAIRDRWPVSAKAKKELMAKASELLESAEDSRDLMRLGSIIQAAEAQNQRDEHLAIGLAAKAAGIDGLRIEVVYQDAPRLPAGDEDDAD